MVSDLHTIHSHSVCTPPGQRTWKRITVHLFQLKNSIPQNKAKTINIEVSLDGNPKDIMKSLGLLLVVQVCLVNSLNLNESTWISEDITQCREKYAAGEMKSWNLVNNRVKWDGFALCSKAAEETTQIIRDAKFYSMVCLYKYLRIIEYNCLLRERMEYLLKYELRDLIPAKDVVEGCFSEATIGNRIDYKDLMGCLEYSVKGKQKYGNSKLTYLMYCQASVTCIFL